MGSYHPTKFGDHRHCGNGDMMVLVCHMILQDQVMKRSCDFMGRRPIEASYHPVKVSGHSHSSSGVVMILVCHMISQDHKVKGQCGKLGGTPTWKVTILTSLEAIGIVVVETCFKLLKRKIPDTLASIYHYCLSLKDMA